jgi:hypothetical protein
MQLMLELFICAHQAEETLCYHRLCRDISQRREDPDGIVIQLLLEAGIDNRDHAAWSHSTSWRYERERTLLTYIVWVPARVLNGLPTRCLALEAAAPAPAAGPLAPRPREIREEDVLIHGLRHLHYLTCHKREPLAVRALADGQAMAFIQRLAPALAGRLS